MPRKMNAQYKKEWDLFLALEVGFFFPFRHGMSSVQANRAQIGVLLADRDHIAWAIADGNQQKAASYLTPKYEEFWRSVVPNDQAVPEKTVTSRINRAIRLLASALTAEAEPLLSPIPVAPVARPPRDHPSATAFPSRDSDFQLPAIRAPRGTAPCAGRVENDLPGRSSRPDYDHPRQNRDWQDSVDEMVRPRVSTPGCHTALCGSTLVRQSRKRRGHPCPRVHFWPLHEPFPRRYVGCRSATRTG